VSFPSNFTFSGYTLNADGLTSVTSDWTIASGGNLSHSKNGITEIYKIDMTLTGDLTISAGGYIDAIGMGFWRNNRPFGGTPNDGGSHGGIGGDNVQNGTNGVTYGSITAPINIGAGGSSSGDTSDGGGAIGITVTGTTTINGTINASGLGPTGSSGPAGGSVYLTTGFIAGSAAIYANGGEANNDAGGGGGGRIAVILTGVLADFSSYTGTMNAFGGIGNEAQEDGAAGTVYMQSTAQGSMNGTLIIDNNNLDTFDFGSGGTVNTTINGTVSGGDVGAVIIRNDATLDMSGTLLLFTVTGPWLNQAAQTITAGTVLFDFAGVHSITTSTGTFFNVEVTSTGTVTFEDETTFNNFTDTTPSSRLAFNAGSTYTITGSLILQGGSKPTRIILNSDASPAQFAFSVTGSQIVSFVNVNNSVVNTGDIVALTSLDTNTDSAAASPHWIFADALNIYIWRTAAVDGDWENQANWRLLGDPTPGDDGYPDDNTDKALINSIADAITTAGTITVGELELSGTYTGTLTLNGTTTFFADSAAGVSGDFIFTSGTVDHPDNTTVAAGQKDLTMVLDG